MSAPNGTQWSPSKRTKCTALAHLRIDCRVGYLMRGNRNDQLCIVFAKAFHEAVQVVHPDIIVLAQNSDYWVLRGFQHVSGVEIAFGMIAGIEANRPRKVLWIIPTRRPRDDE
jgi:hypothetical protein